MENFRTLSLSYSPVLTHIHSGRHWKIQYSCWDKTWNQTEKGQLPPMMYACISQLIFWNVLLYIVKYTFEILLHHLLPSYKQSERKQRKTCIGCEPGIFYWRSIPHTISVIKPCVYLHRDYIFSMPYKHSNINLFYRLWVIIYYLPVLLTLVILICGLYYWIHSTVCLWWQELGLDL